MVVLWGGCTELEGEFLDEAVEREGRPEVHVVPIQFEH